MVIAMGSDNTMQPHSNVRLILHRFIGLGHRFSIAWLTDTQSPADPLIPSDFSTSCERLAADAALHDGRGCFLRPSFLRTAFERGVKEDGGSHEQSPTAMAYRSTF